METDNNMEMAEDYSENGGVETVTSPPYISFVTFWNMVAWLETEELPLRFDRSFWSKKYSGTTGLQLVAGLRFLGLLKGTVPQPIFEELVELKGEERKKKLAEIIKHSYTNIDFTQLDRAVPSMLDEWFKPYNYTGSTLRKAEAFFINACKIADISLSKSLQKKARNKPSRITPSIAKEKKPRKPKGGGGDGGGGGIPVNPPQYEGQVSKITLKSGGEVIVSINANLFTLSDEDNDFVMKLVKTVKEYQISSEE